jgi:hypothetical protein
VALIASDLHRLRTNASVRTATTEHRHSSIASIVFVDMSEVIALRAIINATEADELVFVFIPDCHLDPPHPEPLNMAGVAL